MPNFKPKTNKKIEIDEKSIVTVDSKHDELMNSFKKEQQDIKAIKKEIKLLKQLITENNYDTIDEKLEHIDKLNELKKHVRNTKNKKKQYLLNNAKYVFDYFETKKNISKNNNKKRVLNNFFNIEKKATNT